MNDNQTAGHVAGARSQPLSLSRSQTLPPSPSKPHPRLHARVQGSGGDTVLCLHSSVGSNAQWRGLAQVLAQQHRVVCPDLHGHGHSPAWPVTALNTLHVDAHAVSGLLPTAVGDLPAQGVHLVGHSYGGAVALQMALRQPRRVLSLTLYEPVPFGMLKAHAGRDAATAEIEDIRHSVSALLGRGDLAGAARVFIVYWGGAAAWDALDADQRTTLMARIRTVPRHFDALFHAGWSTQLLQCLAMPVLLMKGSATRAPADRVTQLLATALPHARLVRIEGAGHLGPITHAASVNAQVTAHLGQVYA